MPTSRRPRAAAPVLLAGAAVAALGLLAGCGSGSSGPPAAARPAATAAGAGAGAAGGSPGVSPSPSPTPRPQLPLGGRTLLPTYRVVAYYGSEGGPGLGVLGAGSPDEAARRILAAARPYRAAGRPVHPAMELITTVASSGPGPDGTYSVGLSPASVQRYLDAARRHKMLLLLDLQPGRGDFLTQARRYERFLRLPDVGLALDPEWRMGPTEVPARVIGHADAAEINRVSAWLAGIVRRDDLPQKLFVVHQFTATMVVDKPAVVTRPGLATVFHIDGFGGQQIKIEKYRQLSVRRPFFNGFKLFYRQDVDMMSPAQAMALRPQPDLVTYQ